MSVSASVSPNLTGGSVYVQNYHTANPKDPQNKIDMGAEYGYATIEPKVAVQVTKDKKPAINASAQYGFKAGYKIAGSELMPQAIAVHEGTAVVTTPLVFKKTDLGVRMDDRGSMPYSDKNDKNWLRYALTGKYPNDPKSKVSGSITAGLLTTLPNHKLQYSGLVTGSVPTKLGVVTAFVEAGKSVNSNNAWVNAGVLIANPAILKF